MSNACESVGELAEQMTAKGWTTKTISLNGSEAINSLAQAWEFPSYFGNKNAFRPAKKSNRVFHIH